MGKDGLNYFTIKVVEDFGTVKYSLWMDGRCQTYFKALKSLLGQIFCSRAPTLPYLTSPPGVGTDPSAEQTGNLCCTSLYSISTWMQLSIVRDTTMSFSSLFALLSHAEMCDSPPSDQNKHKLCRNKHKLCRNPYKLCRNQS